MELRVGDAATTGDSLALLRRVCFPVTWKTGSISRPQTRPTKLVIFIAFADEPLIFMARILPQIYKRPLLKHPLLKHTCR